MGEKNTKSNNAAFSVNFVQASYFLVRIQEFEAKYKQDWGEFLADYSLGKSDPNNSDYEEWAFLCRHFGKELIESERDDPPDHKIEVIQKPESDSGFCFFGDYDVRSRALLQYDVATVGDMRNIHGGSGRWSESRGKLGHLASNHMESQN